MSDMIKENRITGTFGKIRIRNYAYFEIVQAQEESVVIEALPISQPLIKTEVQGDTLLATVSC